MADSMIERVARALCRPMWMDFVSEARTAVAAMRDFPDLLGNHLPTGYKPGSHSARDIWNSIVDAALAEE